MDPSDTAYAGQEVYSRAFLRIYDPVILGSTATLYGGARPRDLWSSTGSMWAPAHLDVGPGTGYFLERARLPHDARITLLDPNPDVLAHAARRLSDRRPSVIQADVLKPLPLRAGERFDSAAMNYVLHCLPGATGAEGRRVQNVAAVLKPGGVLFGATVLGAAGPHTWFSRVVLRFVNSRRIFDNLQDTEQGLRDLLEASFATVEINVIGSVAVFTART
jgi:SAM-dependent methyltransferase